METKIKELYTKDEPAKLNAARNTWIAVAAVLGILGAAACIAVCLMTKQSNINRMYITAVIISVVIGWIIISIVHFRIDELRFEKLHVNAVLNDERETVSGRFSYTGKRIRIKKGVTMLSVDAKTDSGMKTLYVFEKKKPIFPIEKAVRVHTVNGFITAYEEGEG